MFKQKFKEWIVMWFWLITMVWITWLAFAAFTWTTQSDVTSWNTLTATKWNDMLNNQNYLKQEVEWITHPDISWKMDTSWDTMAWEINMGTNKIVSLWTPTVWTDATNKTYVDWQIPDISWKMDTSWDTMAWVIDMGTNKISNLWTPTASTDAATKAYADSVSASGEWTYQISCGMAEYSGVIKFTCVRVNTIDWTTECRRNTGIMQSTNWSSCHANPW